MKQFIQFITILFILGVFIAGVIFFTFQPATKSYSRTVILYSSDGKEIRRWVSKGTVYCYNNSFRFYDKYSENEKLVQISGTVVVE
jgi:hypothetical protein